MKNSFLPFQCLIILKSAYILRAMVTNNGYINYHIASASTSGESSFSVDPDPAQLLHDLGMQISETNDGDEATSGIYDRMRENALAMNLSPKMLKSALRWIEEMEAFDDRPTGRASWMNVRFYMHPPGIGSTNNAKKFIRLKARHKYNHEAFKKYFFEEVHIIIHGFCPWLPWDSKDNFEYIGQRYFNIAQDLVSNFGWHPVIIMDWTDLATYSLLRYYKAKSNTVEAAKALAKFIHYSPFSAKKFHLVGHSLGSHVAGIGSAGARKLGKGHVGRITGVDPAGVLYQDLSGNVRDWSVTLWKSDADFVDVIHCDTKELGISRNLGHKDTYPNGGHTQPGCAGTMIGSGCSHAKCLSYYQQSIWDSSKMCPCNEKCKGTEMGEHARPDSGSYC